MFFCGFLVWAGLKLWAGFLSFGESFCVGDFIFVFSECLSVQTGGPGHGHGAQAQSLGPQAQDADSHCLDPRQGAQGPGPRPPPSRREKNPHPPVEFFSHARGPRHRGAKKIRTPPVEIFLHLFSSIILAPAGGGIGPVGEAASKNMFPPFAGKRNEKLDEKYKANPAYIFRQVFLWGRGTLLTGWSV